PMRRRGGYRRGGLALLVGLALALPAQAGAATTIGQLPANPPLASCSGSFDYLQPSVTGGTLYVARQAGAITSWTTISATAGATYTFKNFRRTADPDAFQVIAHAAPQTLKQGVNTVPVNLQVSSGDLIGFHVSGPASSCTFSQTGDAVLRAPGDLQDNA